MLEHIDMSRVIEFKVEHHCSLPSPDGRCNVDQCGRAQGGGQGRGHFFICQELRVISKLPSAALQAVITSGTSGMEPEPLCSES